MVCARLSKTFLAGAVAGTVGLASTASLEARPLPVATAATIAGDAPVAEAGWRGYGYRHHGYGYRHYGYRRSHGGAIFAGAALGILGLAAALRRPIPATITAAATPTTATDIDPRIIPTAIRPITAIRGFAITIIPGGSITIPGGSITIGRPITDIGGSERVARRTWPARRAARRRPLQSMMANVMLNF